MKNVCLVLLFLISSACAMAQAPGQINYQAVARNAVGNVIPNQDIKLRLSIRDGSATGTVMYQEIRSVKTNMFGMFHVAIGGPGATGVIGTISGVNWANGAGKYLQVEMDMTGGINWINMGSSQLLSVPFALFAGSSQPSGNAGGSLTGTYPNPQLATSVVKNSNIADGAVNTSKIEDGSVTLAKLAPGVIPTGLPPSGIASGDLTGTYPAPSIAANAVSSAKLGTNAVTTNKIADASVTLAKIAPGVIPTSLPPNGAASGDLTGSYPNPSIGDNTISTSKLQDGSVTLAKLAPGVIGGGNPTGPAGGDLTGTYPNPSIALNAITNGKIADNAITTTKIVDGNVTAAKLAPGVIPATLPPSGAAGGDLTGTYPNPTIVDNAISTSKLQDGSVTMAKLAPGIIGGSTPTGPAGGDLSATYPNPSVVKIQGVPISVTIPTNGQILRFDGTTWSPASGSSTSTPTGPAGGDLNGAYPNPNIAPQAVTTSKLAPLAVTTQKIDDGAVTNPKLADNAVGTSKILDGSVTIAKLAPGIIGGSTPTGPAGGDLTGTYPNPSIALNAVTNGKIADNAITATKISDGAVINGKIADDAVTTSKILDASVTNAKLADNAVTTLKISDASVTALKLAPGVIPTSLPPNGAATGDLSGTYPSPLVARLQTVNLSSTLPTTGQVLKFDGTQWAPGTDNAGSGGGLTLPYTNSMSSASNLFSITNSGGGAALHGVNSSTSANAYGIFGQITSGTPGASSAAIKGQNNGSAANGYGIWGIHAGAGLGVYGVSTSGSGVKGSSTSGNGLEGFSQMGKGVFATSTTENAAFFDISSTSNVADAVFVTNIGLGNGLAVSTEKNNALLSVTNDIGGAGVLGVNLSGGEAVVGRAFGDNGTGLVAQANAGGTGGNALVADLLAGNGNIAVFRYGSANVARIDQTGKGFFNAGTQVGGADVAEFFAVEGKRSAYEPGDVLVISADADRTVTKSSTPYSTLVAGVYATKPGLTLTEENAEQDKLDALVPMGVIGVIPTKVCLEGGAIKRGDLLVTSSISGVAMKADPEKVRVGQVLGKALQDFNSSEIGKINVLVSVK